MKPTLHRGAALAEAADRIGGEQGRAVRGRHVGGEEAGIARRERLDRAGLARRVLRAAALLHAQQLGPAAVELVVADRVEVDPDQVHRRGSSARRGTAAETSGEAPIMSPAETTAVGVGGAQAARSPRRDRPRRRPAPAPARPPARRGRRPILGGSRLPWKSLKAMIFTSTGAAAAGAGRRRSRRSASRSAASRQSASPCSPSARILAAAACALRLARIAWLYGRGA